MKKKNMLVVSVIVSLACGFALLDGCKKNVPTAADAPSLNQATPTPLPISGPLEVYVTDNYLTYPTPGSTPVLNSFPVTGLSVQAIPPSNSVTYTKTTQPDGKAYFLPSQLEVGNWQIVINPQAGYPFAKSVITAPVTAEYETIPVASAPSTLFNSSNSPQVLTSSQGGTVVSTFTYNQPGNLLVPIQLSFPTLPTNWTVAYGPTSIGFAGSDYASVTFVATPCVDHAVTYSVNGSDFEPTPVVRAISAACSITKSYTSTASCSYTQSNYNTGFCSDGYLTLNMSGTLTFTSSNACGNITVYWVSGDCCQNSMQINTTSQNAQDCSGGSFSLAPGSYSLSVINARYQPHMYVVFQGTTYGPYYFQPATVATTTFFNVSF